MFGWLIYVVWFVLCFLLLDKLVWVFFVILVCWDCFVCGILGGLFLYYIYCVLFCYKLVYGGLLLGYFLLLCWNWKSVWWGCWNCCWFGRLLFVDCWRRYCSLVFCFLLWYKCLVVVFWWGRDGCDFCSVGEGVRVDFVWYVGWFLLVCY